MTGHQLYRQYTSFGADPFIREIPHLPERPAKMPFSAWAHAEQQSAHICALLSPQPGVSYTVVSDVCEGIADCIPVCPTECIHWGDGPNVKGTRFVAIDDSACINCGACLSVCPIEGAILDEWKPERQRGTLTTATPATPPPPPRVTATISVGPGPVIGVAVLAGVESSSVDESAPPTLAAQSAVPASPNAPSLAAPGPPSVRDDINRALRRGAIKHGKRRTRKPTNQKSPTPPKSESADASRQSESVRTSDAQTAAPKKPHQRHTEHATRR
jgi:NAD-dependent dihydropyrimidine dehydrogenase PreA subunit